jgi:cytochrome c5
MPSDRLSARSAGNVLFVPSLVCVAALATWTPGCAPEGGASPSRGYGGWGASGNPWTGGSSGAPESGGGPQPPASGGSTSVDAGTLGSGGSDAGASGASGAGAGGVAGGDAGPVNPWDKGIQIPPYPQQLGDPAAGYTYLTSGGYFGCGVPQRFFGLVQPFATLQGISSEALPGRNATVDGRPLGYTWNLAKNADGLDVVYMNCLQCHAGKFNGKLVMGLGNADADWTANLADMAPAADLLALLVPTPLEKKELDKFIGRLRVIGGPAVMRTVGTNPAEMLATTFVSHRDRNTLAWSDTPLLTIPALENQPAGTTITSKTPPWWRMAKKHAQFYNGMGRGDHRRSMMLAGSLCTDSVSQAEAIDKHFDDVAAYIASIEPPAYPFAIDAALAEKGRTLFTESCAGCHGTYGSVETYPNLLIPLEEIGTDPAVALGGTSKEFGSDLVEWYNQSWYGQIGHYEPYKGYVAPPLDAVWATAPYLHNGSVPDIETLLDSTKRPKYWRRVDHDTANYDQNTLGFRWVAEASGQNAPPLGVAAKNIYDTAQYSHFNTGHSYGDSFTPEQRRAVIEYLKTL